MKSTVIGVATLASLALGSSAAMAAPHSPAGSQHYVYSTITVNVGGQTCRHVQMAGINDQGTEVGTVFCGTGQGFVRPSHGGTVKFRGPGGSSLVTQTSSISSNGIISLYTYDPKQKTFASYLRGAHGKMTAIVNPLAGPGGTRVLAVNASQEAVGVYYTDTKTSVLAPFVVKDGVAHAFQLGISGATNVILTGVTDKGVLSGQYSDRKKTVRGFIYTGGVAHQIKVPGAPVASKRGSGVTNVAKGEVLTGDVYSKNAVTGFVGRESHFTTVTVPSSVSTFCQGVNTHHVVVGFYLTPTGAVRGFAARLSS